MGRPLTEAEKKSRDQVLYNICHPNIITSLRLLTALVVIWLAFIIKIKPSLGDGWGWLYILIGVIGFTSDVFDGLVARTTNRITTFGTYYDHWVDGILVTPFLFMIYQNGIVPLALLIPAIFFEVRLPAYSTGRNIMYYLVGERVMDEYEGPSCWDRYLYALMVGAVICGFLAIMIDSSPVYFSGFSVEENSKNLIIKGFEIGWLALVSNILFFLHILGNIIIIVFPKQFPH